VGSIPLLQSSFHALILQAQSACKISAISPFVRPLIRIIRDLQKNNIPTKREEGRLCRPSSLFVGIFKWGYLKLADPLSGIMVNITATFLFPSQQLSSPMTVSALHWQHQFIDTNHIRLHCVVQGEGDLVVLLHGFPEFWYSWRYQIPALAKHFKVVVPDLRGYNDSDKPKSGYDIDTLARDVRGLVHSLGYDKAHIVGHDWGGAIAWQVAHQFPTLLNRLAVLNAPHPQRFIQDIVSNLDQLRRSWYVLAFQVPGLPEWLIQQNLKTVVKNLFQGQCIRKGAFTTRDTEIYQAALEKPGVLAAVMNYYRQLLSPQAWMQAGLSLRQINPITAPTLVLWGEEDAFLSQKVLDGLDKLVKASFYLKRLPECGHWVQQEAPQTVNRELLDFLRQS
jgi:epoxide hydrolase 4